MSDADSEIGYDEEMINEVEGFEINDSGWLSGLKYVKKNEYRIFEDCGIAEVRLMKGQDMIIDIEDLKYLKNYCVYSSWNLNTKSFYAKTHVGRSNIGFHRILISCEDQEDIDHRNHETLDNRKENLRAVSQSINMRNKRRRIDNTSGISGICFDEKKNLWRARIVN